MAQAWRTTGIQHSSGSFMLSLYPPDASVACIAITSYHHMLHALHAILVAMTNAALAFLTNA